MGKAIEITVNSDAGSAEERGLMRLLEKVLKENLFLYLGTGLDDQPIFRCRVCGHAKMEKHFGIANLRLRVSDIRIINKEDCDEGQKGESNSETGVR